MTPIQISRPFKTSPQRFRTTSPNRITRRYSTPTGVSGSPQRYQTPPRTNTPPRTTTPPRQPSPRRSSPHRRHSSYWPQYKYGWRYYNSPVIAGAEFINVYSPVPVCPSGLEPLVDCVPELKQKNMTIQYDPFSNSSNVVTFNPDSVNFIDDQNNPYYFDDTSDYNATGGKQKICKDICLSKYPDTLNSPIIINPSNNNLYECGCIVPTYRKLCDYTCD